MTSTLPSTLREPFRKRELTSSSTTTWGYVRHELLFLSFALMEIALIAPVVLIILGWARYWPDSQVAIWLLLLMVLPLNLIRLMGLLNFNLKLQRRVLIGGLVLTILFSWRLLLYDATSVFDFTWLRLFINSLGEGTNLLWTRDLSVFLVTAVMWWRGIRLAIRQPEINNVGLRLRLGGLILLPFIVWFGSSYLDTSIVPYILLFFLTTLTAVSLVRAENIEKERTGTAATLNVRWFLAVFSAALAVVMCSAVVGAFFAGDSLFTVMAGLSPVWRAIQFSAIVAFQTLFKIANPALEVFAIFVQFLAEALANLTNFLTRGLSDSNILQEQNIPNIPFLTPAAETNGALLSGKSIALILMLGLVVLIALALARSFRQATFAARESERSQSTAEEKVPGMGQRLMERLGIFRQWRAVASVRKIYRQMIGAAAAAGFPRLATETPYEFLPTLAIVWPEHPAEYRLITEAFVRVRYGEIPETDEELEAIQAAWRMLEAAKPQRRDDPSDNGPSLDKRK